MHRFQQLLVNSMMTKLPLRMLQNTTFAYTLWSYSARSNQDQMYVLLQDEIVNELASNKVYLQGNDIQGRTVFVVLAKQQEMGRAEETKRFICYTLDNAIAAADPARNELRQFLCLFDLSGVRLNFLPAFLCILIGPHCWRLA